MPVQNAVIAAMFDQAADLLEIERENQFRVRAYGGRSRHVGHFEARSWDKLTKYENVDKVLVHGPTRTTVMRSGIQVDLRAVSEESYGAALLFFASSNAHNIALRGLAIKGKWKLSEYGLFSGRRRIAGATEEEVYKKLGHA